MRRDAVFWTLRELTKLPCAYDRTLSSHCETLNGSANFSARENSFMRMPNIKGLIRRRILVNYRVDPAVIQRQLPGSFHPKLQRGYAVAGGFLCVLGEMCPKKK